jgi:integrase
MSRGQSTGEPLAPTPNTRDVVLDGRASAADARSGTGQALARATPRVLLARAPRRRSVSSAGKRWQPPEGLQPEDVQAVIAAATTERDRLLLATLWATGARVSEVLELRPMDVERDALVLPNLKNPSARFKRVYLPAGQRDLPGALLLYARERGIGAGSYIFAGRWPGTHLRREHAWLIVRRASERAGVQVRALRGSKFGEAGDPAPLHPHLFRHARVRQIVRQTRSLPLAQRQAGWSRLQTVYLTVGDQEARELMQQVTE